MIEFDWSQLTPTQFEDLCCDILREEKFVNPKRISGTGSGDKKRDIIAEEIIKLKVGLSFSIKYLIQCKNYFGSKTSLSSTFVEECVRRAETLHHDIVLIITSWDLSSPAKEIAEIITNDKSRKVKVCYWTQSDLVTKLMNFENLILKYFKTPVKETRQNIIQGTIDESGLFHLSGIFGYGEKREYISLDFIIDTGTSITAISHGIIDRMGIDISTLETQLFYTANGTLEMRLLRDVEILFRTIDEELYSIKIPKVALFPENGQYKGINLIGTDVLTDVTLTSSGEIIFKKLYRQLPEPLVEIVKENQELAQTVVIRNEENNKGGFV